MSRLQAARQQRKSDERFAERFAQQWATMRAERRRRGAGRASSAGESNYDRGRVPYGVDLAAAWSLAAAGASSRAGYVVALGIAMFAVVVLPLVIALLLAALVVPLVDAAGPAAAAARGRRRCSW